MDTLWSGSNSPRDTRYKVLRLLCLAETPEPEMVSSDSPIAYLNLYAVKNRFRDAVPTDACVSELRRLSQDQLAHIDIDRVQ